MKHDATRMNHVTCAIICQPIPTLCIAMTCNDCSLNFLENLCFFWKALVHEMCVGPVGPHMQGLAVSLPADSPERRGRSSGNESTP